MKGEQGSAQMGGALPFEGASATIAAAHELKSPLVLIRQLALALKSDELSASRRTELIDQIAMVSERGLRLTGDLTRTARLDDALFEVEPVNAQQVCESIVAQIRPLYEHYGRSIDFTARRARPIVLAHRELLASVVYHFADNALHYGDEKSAVSVSLTARTAEKVVRIGVRDKGPAMTIREWRQAKSHAKARLGSRPQASGLGLYITEQFSRAMGGTTGLVRHRDGATFYVDVPISEQLLLL